MINSHCTSFDVWKQIFAQEAKLPGVNMLVLKDIKIQKGNYQSDSSET